MTTKDSGPVAGNDRAAVYCRISKDRIGAGLGAGELDRVDPTSNI